MSDLARPEDSLQTPPQTRVLEVVLPDCGKPLFRELEIPPRASGVRLLESGRDEPLLLEAAQSDEDRRLRDRPAALFFQREDERHTVRLTVAAQHGQQDLEFEVL